jgi:hypothetical protein
MKRLLYTILLSVFLTGCAGMPYNLDEIEAEKVEPTKFKRPFPEPETGQPIIVAVYQFTDKTGQRKDSASIAKLSSAVT